MRDCVVLVFVLAFLILGAALVYESGSEIQASQTVTLLSGASFIAIGLFGIWAALNEWLKWKKEDKEFRGE